ncbi:MAG TPA: hypothetical protein VH853_12585 [Polyangia bacterium]|jgi:hypothetical protein|nr:hypothetical protein [Polyangia bacterium]
MSPFSEQVRAPTAGEPAAEPAEEAGPRVEFQPESGALAPREAAPDADDGTDPGDDL